MDDTPVFSINKDAIVMRTASQVGMYCRRTAQMAEPEINNKAKG